MVALGKLTASVLALIVLGAGLTGCSAEQPRSLGEDITVGSHGTMEGEILAQIYGQALADNGFVVDYNYGVGSYTNAVASMRTGIVDLIPDYAGGLLKKVDPHSTTSVPEVILSDLPVALAPLGLAMLEPSGAESTMGFVTTREYVAAHSLVSIGDISLFASAVSIGGEADFETSAYGRLALLNNYGINEWKAVERENDAAIIEDLVENRTQVAIVPKATPGIVENGLVILNDPQHLLDPNPIVPIIPARKYSPEFAEVVNSVSEKLTTEELAWLKGLAQDSENETGTEQTIDTIARTWLKNQGLIEVDES